MKLSETGKSLIRKILSTAVFLCLINDGRVEYDGDADGNLPTFSGEELRITIGFRNDMYNANGLPGGFSYELAKDFAEYKNKTARIRVADRHENLADSVIFGQTHILITRLRDSLYHPDLIRSVQADNHTVWHVSHEHILDLKEINLWLSSEKGSREYMNMRNRFYSLYDPFKRLEREVRTRRISPYDELIKKHAAHIGWDWRLLAAVMYQESRFSINTVSHRGASGLMQIMPSTGAYYGITDLLDPEKNIEAGCRHFSRLGRLFDKETFGDTERIKFILAAYNAGEGRIEDCRNLASARGLDSTVWDEVVKVIPEMSHESILLDENIRFGRFRGTETINYVDRIMRIYEAFRTICP